MSVLFSVGDVVELIEDHPDDNEDLYAGCTGTVVGDRGGGEWVNVEWDDEICGGHNCEGKCRDGHGWNVPRKVIRLVFTTEVEDSDIATREDLLELFQVAPLTSA